MATVLIDHARLDSLDATETLGKMIAAGLALGDCVALSGDLGSGKTALVRAILRALGVTQAVPSPTFTLVQTYETPSLIVHHFDLYRLDRPEDVLELGLEDALTDGAALVEWPQMAGSFFPETSLWIGLEGNGPGSDGQECNADMRIVTILGPSRWAACLKPLI